MEGAQREATQLDTITNLWLWFAAAAMVLVLVAAVTAYYFLRPKPNAADAKEADAIEEDQKDQWIPTGRIDFIDAQSVGNFMLRVEVTRGVESTGGVEHREIRWRRATLDEAKRVIVAYHAQRNLTLSGNFIVTSPRTTERRPDVGVERQEPHVEKDKPRDNNTASGETSV